MSLSPLRVEKAKAGADPFRIADEKALYLLVQPNGAKLWRMDYRFLGKRRTLAIGQFPDVSLAAARDRRDEAREHLAAGRDPVEQKRLKLVAAIDAAERTFEVLAKEWLTARELGVSKRTYARDKRSVRYLNDGYRGAPGFGKMPVEQVRSNQLSTILEKLNKPTRARVLSAARKIMGIAKRKNFISQSPFADVDFEEGFEPHRERKRPALTDPQKFGQLLRKIDLYEGRGQNLVGYGLRLLALTFVRPGTVQNAEWREFNLKSGFWVVPFEKLKMHRDREEKDLPEEDLVVPLSRQALELLRELHRRTSNHRYLFPGKQEDRPISENTLNNALIALGYKGTHCAHGFRSSASTILNRERVEGRRRFEPSLIELQLDHKDRSVRAIYDRDDCLPERVELMQFWADRIDRLSDVAELLG